jgi:ATP-dependent protease HslVU (ClpYQ) ATPase subunit
MATLMEDLLFDLPKAGLGQVVIDAKIVEEKLGKVAGDDDLRRYIL